MVTTDTVVQFIQGWVLKPFILDPQEKNPLFTIMTLLLGELL